MESAQKRKMHVELARLHLQQVLSHISCAECFTERKNRQHFHHPTVYYYSRERRSVGMLQQYVSITLPVCVGPRSLNAGVRNAWRPENDDFSLVYRELRHLSAVDRDLKTFSGKTAYLSYTNGSCSLFCSHTPYDDAKCCCCFLSETFSK